MNCPRCSSPILAPATTCGCGAASAPTSPAAGDAPPPVPLSSPDDFVGRMIPTGNKPSLIGYYCAFGAWIPFLGIPLAVVAVWFGVKGVRLEKRHPQVRGGCHAWFGIVAGAGLGLVGLAMTIALILAFTQLR